MILIDKKARATCQRCGYEWEFESVLLYSGDYDYTYCKSCKAKPAEKIYKGKLICRPWTGELNDEWQPIDDKGNLYLPGERICGHKDCVNRNHISTPDAPKEKVQRPSKPRVKVKTTCKHIDCRNRAVSRGVCNKHYMQLRRIMDLFI